MKSVILILGICWVSLHCAECLVEDIPAVAGDKFTKFANDSIGIYCYAGEDYNFAALWKSARFRIKPADSGIYEVLHGDNASDVLDQYEGSRSVFNFLPWVTDKVRVPVFNKSCVGVVSNDDIIVMLEVIRIDYWKVLRLFGGIVLFSIAAKLSKNVIFYYTSGVSLGLLASLLIVVFVIGRLVPRKFGAIGVMIGGWAVVLYILQLLWGNVHRIIQTYRGWVMCYLLSVGLFSFAVCYYYGPVKNERMHKLIQWTLQIIALLSVFYSTEWQEVAMALVLLMLAIKLFPSVWVSKIQYFWRRKFPPKLKLLTEDEYHKQGVEFTHKALEELRGYCSSPDCKSWRLMNKLKSPLRFADFVEGNSHLRDEEMLNYETETSFLETSDMELTDDESEVDN